MNKQRRQDLSKQLDKLEAVKNTIIHELGAILIKAKVVVEASTEILEGIKNDVDEIRNDEQEAYDNMPQGLQASEKGQAASEAVDYLDTAMSTIDEVMEKLKELTDFDIEGDIDQQLQEVFENIDNAKGEL